VLYIQSEARQGVAVYLGPAESVHLKEIRGTQRIVCINQRLELLGLAKWCSRRRVATGWLDC
jgi:hypothetical protein